MLLFSFFLLSVFHEQNCIFSFDELLTILEAEITKIYQQILHCAVVNYYYIDSDKQRKLFVEMSPIEHPVLHIRAPVPWHQSKLMASHLLEYNLFIGNEILRDIQNLYFFK